MSRQKTCAECGGPLGEHPRVHGAGWVCSFCARMPPLPAPELDVTAAALPPGTVVMIAQPSAEEQRQIEGMSTEERLRFLARQRRIAILKNVGRG